MRGVALALAAVLAGGCGGNGSRGTGDGGPAGDAGGADANYDDVIELTEDADGAERGTGVTGDDGVVRFYSARHDALFQLAMADADDAALAGVEVSMEAREDGATYWAEDPSGAYAPMLFSSEIPTELGQELSVSGKELFEQGGDVFEFDEGDGDPFQNLILGFTVSLNIRAVMFGLGEAAALMALKKLVEETCLFFAPLHDDVCGVVATVVDVAANAAVAGVKLVVKKGLTWTAGLAQATWSQIWSELRDKGCEAGAKALVTWLVPAPDGEKTVQTRYRQVAYKYRYALKKLDETPPADGADLAAAKDDLALAGQAVTLVAGKVRDHYYEVYNADPDTFLTEASFKTAGTVIKNLVEVRPLILQSLTIAYGYEQLLTVTSTSVTFEAYEFVYGEAEIAEGEEAVEAPWQARWGLDCALAAAKSATITWMENDAQQQAELDIETAVGYMLDIIEAYLDDVHAEYWGGDIPDPDCLPDLWEPNDTWQAALAAPFAGYLDSGAVVEVDNLNLCDGQSAADEDWFAFDAAPINFNVQSRIRTSSGGTSGENERICLELYWYSEIYEIGGFDPSVISGPYCGTVASEFSTGQVNVAQVTGESYRYVLARIYPDPAVATPNVGIDYKLTFTP